ncbi:hypothetical protein AVEN_35334-1, partial [Araneus ventricosus]
CWAQIDSVSSRVFNLRCLEQIGNAPRGFKITGNFPFNNNALPDHLFYALVESEVPVLENTTQEEANSSSKVLINAPQINLQPEEPGISSVKPLSPTYIKSLLFRDLAHNGSSDIDECSHSIKFTTPKEKKEKIKSKKAKKDASQDDNNEQLDHTCDADVLCKECSENYYKTKRKCDWLRCKCGYMKTVLFSTLFCVDCRRKSRSINK